MALGHWLKDYFNEGSGSGGSGGGGVFKVTFSSGEGGYVANHTLEEIIEANEAGMIVIGETSYGDETFLCYLERYTRDTDAWFTSVIIEAGTINCSSYRLLNDGTVIT